MSDNNNININTPEIGPYTQLKPFRFWCQKVLPLVYDESLSYYELLCKVVDYLNKTMEDVDQMITDMGEFQTADRDFKTDMVDRFIAFTRNVDQTLIRLKDYIDNYFTNLNVQTEINNKLDAMAEAGYFDTLFTTLFTDDIITEAGNVTSAWIAANLLQETGYVIDKSLTVEGAAADAKATGDVINKLNPIYETNTKSVITKTEHELTWTDGYYYHLTTGVITPLANYKCSNKIDCKPGDVISITNNTGQILFWNDEETLATPYISTSYNSTKTVSAPAGAVKYAFNNANAAYLATSAIQRATNQTIIEHNYTAPAKLLFDKDNFANKEYVSTVNGVFYEGDNYSAWYCLPFIPVKSNHKYRTQTQTQIIFYDANMTFISSISNNDGVYTGLTIEMDFTTPASCKYISINSKSTHEMLFDLDYTFAGNVINPKKLIGKTIVCFGDSITGNYGFGDNYPYQIEENTGAKTYNCGFGGCRMEYLYTDPDHTNAFSMIAIADALEAAKNGDEHAWDDMDAYALGLSSRVYFRLQILKSIDFSQVDIVTIAYGTNEAGFPQDNENDQFDKHTYAGATRYAINKLLTIYPNLRIVLLTPIYRYRTVEQEDSDTWTNPTYGFKLTDNVNTLINVGKEMKTPVIDLYYTLGINIWNWEAYFGDSDEQSDGTHINSMGRMWLGRRIAGELNRLF